ncbi:MAG: Hsp20/alpha crystallin family protein [Bacteroidota bacterium]
MSNLIRLSTGREFDSLRREMNRLFEDFYPNRRASDSEAESAVWTPRADLAENEDAFVLALDLPGIDKDTLAITLDEGTLKISGERQFASEESGHQFHRIERSYGKFFRSFRVGNAVNAEGIDASFENGVLTVTLPKAEERKPRRIEVK